MGIMNLMKKISYDERQKKKLEQYLSKKQKYSKMTNDELEMNYIKIISKYEHKKIVLLTVMSTIFISILSNSWKYFFNMIKELALYMYKTAGNTEPAKTALLATITLAVTFFCVIIVIIIDFFHSMRVLTEDKIFIERLINKHND